MVTNAIPLLDLKPGFSAADIEQEYKFLALVCHPDRFPEKWRPLANEKMRQLNEARAALKNYSPVMPSQTSQNKPENSKPSPAGLKWMPAYVERIQICNAGAGSFSFRNSSHVFYSKTAVITTRNAPSLVECLPEAGISIQLDCHRKISLFSFRQHLRTSVAAFVM